MSVGTFFYQTLLFTFKSMTQFSDLYDDRILEVLDWVPPEELFKLLRVNRRFNRLATERLRDKVKVIHFTEASSSSMPKCAHFGNINQDQVLVLGAKFTNLHDPSSRAFFLKVLSKCAGLKSIDFCFFKFPIHVFIDVFRRCPQVDCVKLSLKDVQISEWNKALKQIGHKIVQLELSHLDSNFSSFSVRNWCSTLSQMDTQLIKTVASKCPNIERLTFTNNSSLTNDLIAAFKKLPKNCWITVICFWINDQRGVEVFQDVVDDLRVKRLIWSELGQRLDRLSSLRCKHLSHDDSDSGLDFAGLKKFGFTAPVFQSVYVSYSTRQNPFRHLIDSRFPRLEEFCFNAVSFTEEDYDRLFQKMPSVKKLTVLYDYDSEKNRTSQLPRLAIHHLKNLETIEVNILKVSRRWQPVDFLKQLEIYVDRISLLKKLTVDTKGLVGKRKETVESEVNKLKIKLEQNINKAKLDVLDDDCLMQVLERLPTKKLFKMLRLNKRINRLATVKLQVKIKVIKTSYYTRDCDHLGAISKEEVLIIESMYRDNFKDTKSALFLSLLTKCSSVKSIEFPCFNLTSDFLMQVVRRCPELECIKLDSNADEDAWNQFMDRIGEKIIHFESNYSKTARIYLLQTIASKCINIKRVDWFMKEEEEPFINNLLVAFKMLPKNCWVKLDIENINEHFTGEIFEVVDELDVSNLDCSLLGDRIDRLSDLTFSTAKNWIKCVDFAGLEKLDFEGVKEFDDSFKFLLVCQFPRLKEFRFKAGAGFEEADYDVLFSRMPSVKKLVIEYQETDVISIKHEIILNLDPHLPRSSIYRLKNLETIILNVRDFPGPVHDFVQPIHIYVDGNISLKETTVDLRLLSDDTEWNEWAEAVEEEVERMKMKQSRVQIELIL